MCSNYQLYKNADDLEAYYDAKWEIHKTGAVWKENIFPRFSVPVTTTRLVNGLPRGRVIEMAHWGWWLRERKGKPIFNSRSESIVEKSRFYAPRLLKSRCLMPVTGFFEPAGEARVKTLFSLGGEIFSIGGFMTLSEWKAGAVAVSMITVPAGNEMAGVHRGPLGDYRQPLLIPRALESAWLDPDLGFENVVDMMRSWPFPGLVRSS